MMSDYFSKKIQRWISLLTLKSSFCFTFIFKSTEYLPTNKDEPCSNIIFGTDFFNACSKEKAFAKKPGFRFKMST